MAYIGNAPAAGIVDSGNILDGTVGTADLANSAVTTAKVADGSITSSKIIDAAVTAAKLSASAITDKLGYTPANAASLASYLPLSGGTLSGEVNLSAGRFYVAAASSGQAYGGTIHVRDIQANGSNNSFTGIAFSSAPGTDYVIGKYTEGGVGYLQIKDNNGSQLLTIDSSGSQRLPNRRVDFYSYINTSNGQNYQYVHIKTNRRPDSESQMYSVRFEGHSYGQSRPIDASLVWYNYGASNNVINVGSNGTHTCSAYKSSDGYAVITIYFEYLYYVGFSVSQCLTAQGLSSLTVLAATNSSDATGVY